MRCHSRRTAILITAAICVPAWAEASANEILDATGVRGGLVVHLGCGNGQVTAELRAGDSFLIQGLDTNAKNVAQAREHIASLGLTGVVTADTYDGKRLPYADRLVNLIVVEDLAEVSRAEVMRVLAPNGVLYVKTGESWKKTVKPWPKDLDQWTHFHHDPRGTMVGNDTAVGPPRKIQWMAGPKWLRNHDFMSSMHAMVSAEGRVFYIIDEGLRNHIFLPARWTLVARDGFNGTLLWKKSLPDWHPNNWPLKSGPGHNPRKLVAVGDRVYVAAGLTQPVMAFEAATGKVVKTYEQTKPTQEIVLADGILYLLADPKIPPVDYRAETSTYKEIKRAESGWAWTPDRPARAILAVDAASGSTLWNHPARVAPLTLTVSNDQVFYHNGSGMVALDRQTGKERWTTTGPAIKSVPTGGSLRVVFANDIVLFANKTKLTAFAAENGRQLWDGTLMKTSHHCPEDLFVIDDGIWSINTGKPQQDGTHFKVMNLQSGEITKDFVAENLPGFPMHPRCYPSRATTRFIMTNGMGTEFYEVGGTTVDINNSVRGSCIYGIMPSNGFLYKPADSCACYYQSKLEYFCALAPESAAPERLVAEDQRLEKGEAYGKRRSVSTSAASDWPMYRGDTTRSGANSAALPADLKQAWTVQLQGKLTQPVVAGGKVLVAAIDAHTLHALDANSGDALWQYTAGGRIDSSPTVHNGTVLFGSADGYIYCLDADTGTLAWRYLVAFGNKKIVSLNQVESAWPVSGSVIVNDDVLYCLAGRNMFFDGGLRMVLLNPTTGKLIGEQVMDENDPRTGKNLQTLIEQKYMPIANADILSCDGNHIYMQAQRFDLEGNRLGIAPSEREADGKGRHLFCQTGLLDDLWFHRSYWIYGENCGEGWGNYADTRQSTPCGRIMVVDDQRAYAFRSDPLGNMLHPRTTYQLYAADKNPTQPLAEPTADAAQARKTRRRRAPADPNNLGGCRVHWRVESMPLLANAMALGGKTLLVAGPPDVADETAMFGFLPGADDHSNKQLREQEQAWQGKKGGLLWAVSAKDGRKLAEYRMDSYPVFDGMSVAAGKLYMSMIDGSICCFAD
jgi:outer membrane protein assembly factor BamB/ubiquinone/menaquinone biosynthesis C-methylase UbiE